MKGSIVLLVAAMVWSSSGCKGKAPTQKKVEARSASTARPAAPAPRPDSAASKSGDGRVFGFRIGMTRAHLLAAMKPRFSMNRPESSERDVRARGTFLGKSASARFHLRDGKLVQLFILPHVEGDEIAGRTIVQSTIYLAVVKEMGAEGRFRGGPKAREAQLGEATWDRGDTTVGFSLDAGHIDRSGRSFVSAMIHVKGRAKQESTPVK